MPDVNEITLGFGNGPSTFQKPVTPTPHPNTEPAFRTHEDNLQTSPINQVLCNKVVSTPFHPSTNVFSLPDLSNISFINGTACVTTENTIVMERPPVNTNRTAAMRSVLEHARVVCTFVGSQE